MAVEITDPAAIPARLVVGAIAGFVATLVMDIPMKRLPEGETPSYVAAGLLEGESLDDAPDQVATAVHYGAGTLSGVLFVSLTVAVETLLDTTGSVLAVVAAAIVQFPLMVVVFSYVVLVVYGRVPDDRVAQVRRDWARSAAVYVGVVTVLTGTLVFV
jgi:hypothetical protein